MMEYIQDNSVAVLVVTACLVAGALYLKKTKDNRLLPGIPVVPANSWWLGFTNWGRTDILFPFLEAVGPVVQYTSYGHHVVVLADPALAKKALRNIHGKGFFHNPNPAVIETNTFNAQTGPEWQKRRSAFRRAFSTSCLRHHMASISHITSAIADTLEAKCDSKEVFRIDDVFQCLTIEIICKMAFEMDLTPEKTVQVREALQSIFEERWVLLLPFSWYILRLPFGPFRRRKLAGDFYGAFKNEILAHIRSLHAKNALPKDSLAESILQFSELPGVVEREVIGEIGVFFLAGMDTTAHTMALAIYSLAANPSVQRRAQQEMDKHTAESCSSDSLPSYVEAVLKESMRKYPTASTGSYRLVREEGGYELSPEIKLAKGSWVLCNMYALQNSSRIWGTDADQFKPERFLSDAAPGQRSDDVDPLDAHELTGTPGALSTDNAFASHSAYAGAGHSKDELAFMPFSFGLRNCIGMNLALLELRVGLGMLLKRFTFELGDPVMLDDKNMFETRFTSRARDGLPIRVMRR